MWQLIKTVLRIVGYVWAWAFIIYSAYRFIMGAS